MKLLSFARWRSGALVAATRFPWNILCGVVGAASIIETTHWPTEQPWDGICRRLAMTAAVGMPLFFSLRMIRERSETLRRRPIELIGLVLLAGWFLLQPEHPTVAPGIVWIRWLLVLAALHFFAAVSLYVRGAEGPGFWQFNRKLFLRFCLTTLYTGVLTIGLELALLSADKLFQFKVDKGYGDLFFVMIGVFHPTFFLAGVPQDFAALDTETDYPRGLRAFTQFALAPLVGVYTAILYAYAIKIVIARSWPHGWVALPVLLLSGIGILAFLLLFPLRTHAEDKWANWFTHNFPRALAPLSILLLLSVDVRVRHYGVTEERYLGLAAGGWILAWATVFIVRHRSGIRWIPASLAIIAFLAAFGPWSAGSISKASQLGRLQHMLQAHGMWQDNHARASAELTTLSEDEETDFRTTLSYLIGTHGGATIQKFFDPVLQRDWKTAVSWQATRDIIEALKIRSHQEPNWSRVQRKEYGFLPVDGFSRVTRISPSPGNTIWCPVQCDDVTIGFENGALKIQTFQDNNLQTVPLDDLFRVLETVPARDSGSEPVPDERLTVNFQHGARTFRIVFDSVSFTRDVNGIQLKNCDFYLLEK